MAEVTESSYNKRKREVELDDSQSESHPSKKCMYLAEESEEDDESVYESIAHGLRTPNCRLLLASPFMTPRNRKAPPLPHLPWADRLEMWKVMMKEDEEAAKKRNVHVFENNPALVPRMRTILLDWLSEVCEVYRLHRETYFLTIDYIDRYLSSHRDLPKTQLQLLGITCLFIAAKVEEIYPPKLSEFSYVTDGACTDENIITKEMIVLRELDWELTPMTINFWLSLYMQIYMVKIEQSSEEQNENAFVYPQFSVMNYESAVRICNLAAWDDGLFGYAYSVVAASAIYYVFNREVALMVSNLSWKVLKPCVDWLYPFATVVKETTGPVITGISQRRTNIRTGLTKTIPNIVNDETHTMQTHNVNLDMLAKASNIPRRSPCKPSQQNETPGKNVILTPPKSGRKVGTIEPML